jgi:hypothetical protein
MELNKYVCGNCKLRNDKGKCGIDDREETVSRYACSKISTNFIDKGYLHDSLEEKSKDPESKPTGFCPECNNKLNFEEGCAHCTSCGYTKC